jgi:hypothetical protein
MDEVFGDTNFVAQITVVKTASTSGDSLANVDTVARIPG